MAKAKAPSAPIETVKLVISKFNTTVNQYGKMSIKTEEGKSVNPSGLFQYTPKHMDNLADGCGATDADMLRNAHSAALDDNYLVVQCQSVKAGDLVLDSKGQEIDDPTAAGGLQVYTKDHVRIVNTEILLGDDAVDYIATVNREIDMKITMQKRAAKRGGRKTSAPVVDVASVADEDLD